MEIKVVNQNVTEHPTQALVVNLFKDVTNPGGATGVVDNALGGLITKLIESGEISGSAGEITVLHTAAITGAGTSSSLKAERVVILGLGDGDGFDYEDIRRVSAQVARKLRSLKVQTAATIVHGAGIGGLEPGRSAEAIAEGTLLGLYRFDKYKSPGSDESEDDNRVGPELETLELIELEEGKLDSLRSGVARGTEYGSAANLARDLVNEPPNVLSPTALASIAARMAEDAGIDIKVIDVDECRGLGMGAYLSVAAGSAEPPKFIHLTYTGDESDPQNNIWLIGKGITFDSGGLSLKSPSGMITMKGDMGGGAAVIGAMKAIAALKPKINVHVVCAATENMPGGSATRPGDVVQAMNGKYIEIENTDAEGRVTLADAVCYARDNGASRIVDVATLTGAVRVALGKGHMGAFSNNEELYSAFEAAARTQGEPVWRLPLGSVTREQNRSNIADIRNTGGRDAGSIAAAHFIHEFVEDTPWVHLDIAAFNMSDSVSGTNVRGATGASTRLLIRLVEDLAS